LFVLTALEVGAYEIAHREDCRCTTSCTPHHPVLIVLSAIKFALVALFYMHLKWDGPLIRGSSRSRCSLPRSSLWHCGAVHYEGKFSAMIGPLTGAKMRT
jgi:hypothetical protein